MKIVHLHWGLNYGGIETMLINIANEQAKLGAEVSVIFVNDVYEPSLLKDFSSNVTVHFLGRKSGSFNPMFALRLNVLLSEIKPDVIHMHRSELYGFIWQPSKHPLICSTVHDIPTGTFRKPGLLPKLFYCFNAGYRGNVTLLDKMSKVFAISQAVHDGLKNKYNINSTVVCNGIVTREFAKRDKDQECHRRLKIVMVSRLDHIKKGQDLLISAAAKLKDIEIDFIGCGNSHNYLQTLIKEHHIEDRVRLVGARDQSWIHQHLCDYDLFVQPSRLEGFGLTVAEAMASNVPVLVSSGQGPAEVTCKDKYGWEFENGNCDDLVNKISYIQKHYAEANKKASLALQHVVKTYDVRITAQKYIDTYH